MNRWRVFIFVFLICIFHFSIHESEAAEGGWGLTVYGARLTDGDLDNTATFRFDWEDAYLVTVALSRRFYTYRDLIDFEVEGQVAKHFDEQDHWEFNALGISRWLPFPWDHYIDTSFAMGLGVSYATETPEIEKKNHNDTNQFLAALLFEAAFALPDVPQWEFVARIHHRSGAFGLFNGVTGASNAWGLGVRYNF
jgi:hypothetical protein